MMPKKMKHETQREQSDRFCAEVERLIEAGELNPTEADMAVARIAQNARIKPKSLK
jgi:hypothetical protein